MDRIFDQNYIGNLCEELKQAVNSLKNQMSVMEGVADNAISAMNQVPSDVMDSSIESEACTLKSRIADIDMDGFLRKIEDCETRATRLIPTADSQYCERTEELLCTIRNIKEAVAEIREFLMNTPLTMSNRDFAVAYEAMHEKCNSSLENANAQMDKILSNIKGAEKISTVFSKDPVNLSTGNFIYDHTDLEIGGVLPFKFSRFYNAINQRKGVLGRDWNHNYEVRILTEGKETVLIREEGKEERFIKTSTGAYASVYHSGGTLTETKEGYVYETREQVKYYFDKKGYYLKQETLEGITTMLYYEECGTSRRLIKVVRPTGEHFGLKYDEAGYLLAVTDHTGRTISYRMEKDLLTGVSTPQGHWMNYEYTADGKLKSVINPRGIRTVENEFDSKMRTILQKFPDGSRMSYAYDDEKREVELTERNGSRVTYVHDKQYRDIRHIYSDGEERFEYNKLNQKTLVVDKLGNRTQFGYDSRGNLTRIINALGVKTEIQYNENNQPTYMAVNGKEKARNRYDEEGNLIETKDALGNIYRMEYEAKGRPDRLIQPDGSELKVVYDGRGNISELTDVNGNISRFLYDALNRTVEATDGKGNTTKFEYDASGNITKVTNAEGRERTYEYNESGKVTKITDFDKSTVIREYNVLNKPSKVIDQQGRETLLTYDAMWNLARVVQPDGSRTTYLYDEHNRLGRIRNANGDVVRYSYDANGNRTGVEDEEGNKTKFEYDALGRLVSVTEADGSRISYAYDEEGNLTEVTDALGGKVFMEYDAAGQLIKETNQAGESRSYTYTCLGKTASVTDEAGLVTVYVYEPGGQLKEIRHADGSRENYAYDANGNVTEYTDRRGYRLTYTYDSLDRMTEVNGSDGAKKSYEYDSVGNVTGITDALGNRTAYEYSLTGQLIKVTDALGNRTEYSYDLKDQLTEIRQYGEFTGESVEQNCQVTRYERNPLGLVTKVIDSIGQSESYTYNKRGELACKLDKEGYLTRYGYTAKGDVSHIRYADGREVRLSYNPLRQLQEVEDWLGITRIETDSIGRAIKVTGPEGKTVSYEYDTAGRRTAITYPDNTKAEYKYDELGRLTELVQGGKAITYGYDVAGYLSQKTYPNGMKTAYDYTARGQIAGLIHRDAEGVLDEYSYGYDVLGNKTQIEKTRRGLAEESGRYTYAYDAIGRLEGVAKDGSTLRSYTYDAFGNRTSLTEAGGVTRYAYNALNQLISKIDTVNGNRTENIYRYDRRGNLSLVLENDMMKNEYVYGAINRLEEARNAQGEVSRYIYNGLGHRVRKEKGKIQSESLSLSVIENALDPVKKLESLNFNPSGKINYVIDITKGYHNLLQKCEDDHTQTYLWDGNAAGMFDKGSSEQSYYLQDEMGSPVRLMDENGSLREAYGYDEFGQELYDNQGTVQPFGYTGYQYDSVAGTYFAQAREYRAGEGRFGGEDLIKGSTDMPFTLNHYGYCWGNPMMLVDLDGAWPKIPSLSDIGNSIKNSVNNTVNWVKDNPGTIAIAAGTVVAACVVSCIPVVGTVAAGAVLGAGLDVAFQYGTTGEINVKEVAIAGATGAVASLIPAIGAGIGSKVAKIIGKKTLKTGVALLADMSMNAGLSATSCYLVNKVAYPGEKSDAEIKREMQVSAGISAVLTSVAFFLNGTILKNLERELKYSKESMAYAAAGASGHPNPNDLIGLSGRLFFLNEAKKNVVNKFLKTILFSNFIDLNTQWWGSVLVQSITQMLNGGDEECQE